MAFHDVRLPDYDDFLTQAGPGSNVNVMTMDSGQSRRVVRWAGFRHRYDVAHRARTYERIAEIKRFYLARNGLEHSFRYKDWSDYTSTETGINTESNPDPVTDVDQQIGVGDGTATTFQLVKRYADAAGSHVRKITKPVAGTAVISIDGVTASTGWSVNTTTGIVTFDTAPAMGEIVRAGFEFDVPVTFGEGIADFFAFSLDTAGSASVPALPLVEDLDGSVQSEDIHYGGAKSMTLAGDATIDMSALLWSLLPTVVAPIVTLPALSTVPKGGPIFIIRNVAGSPSLRIADSAAAILYTLSPGETATLYHGLDSAGASEWYLTAVL
jgi:uncharacterized protein (TIGR02217 family)